MDPLALVADHAAAAGLVDVHLVGGRVRDALLGRATLDTDLVVAGDAVAVARDVAARHQGTLVVLDERRDIARVVWERGGVVLDVARQVGGSLAADLAQRDLTVNALAVPVSVAAAWDWPATVAAGDVIDPTGGLADLAARRLRMTSAAAFDRDPLRLLRVPRLAAELGFQIDPSTWAAIQARAGRIAEPAAERVRDELLRLMAASFAAQNVRVLDALGLLAPVLPEVVAGRGVAQSPPHTQDVMGHALAVLEAAEHLQRYITYSSAASASPAAASPPPRTPMPPPRTPMPPAWREMLAARGEDLAAHLDADLGGKPRWLAWRMAALLHDVGKPVTAKADPATGRIRFIGHEALGAELCRRTSERLRLGGQVEDYLASVVGNHLRPLLLADQGPPSRRAVYRFYRSAGAAGVDAVLLSLADNWTKTQNPGSTALAGTAATLLDAWFQDRSDVVAPEPLVTGHDLILALGLQPGPEIGRLLAAIREAQAAAEVADRDAALDLARTLAGGEGHSPS